MSFSMIRMYFAESRIEAKLVHLNEHKLLILNIAMRASDREV